ncbi:MULTISPECIES: TIGR00730 family Rossman fold protein [unclassified Polaromonas]|uniref:LOG family protein n=1 Tax=unclassified Polaromonas TaxID=2638319 RepID=UPI000F096ABE|nr:MULTISPECIES: TIGR00730 family Rossman fold protein [unclassified Polaromonas]AYQ29343.1 TIGR00730 family Rossman fold protein [Polaromonas sp. SP1]QGJ19541.1 TIGR00730 family Rossman fold protein [Polaromonas sp. Pch-P]
MNKRINEVTEAQKPAFSICVYCGSRPGNQPEFAAIAALVGTWIGARGGQLVYGGGRNGLMGILADAALAAGARVVGVIPKALVEKEWAHTGCTELHIVENMHERKRIMAEKADAFLALPGGIGTLEEFFEVWTWRQLGYHDKPVGLLNMGGYYDSLLAFLASSVKTGFMNEWLMDLIRTGTDAEPLLEALVQAAGMTPTATRLDQI